MLFFDLFRHDPNLINVAAGGHLFREGDAGHAMYVLLSGKAQILLGNLPVEDVGAGDVVGELAVIEDAPRSATVRTHTACTFVEIDQARFRFLVEEMPYFAIEVMRVMARRLRHCDAQLKELSAQPVV